jgi:hypothetical protein
MSHVKLDILQEKGFVVLRDYAGPAVSLREWESLEYMDWKSGGDTNFAPIASARGEMECAGFWDHGKPDKDGIWTKNVQANFGRVRIIKLNPTTYEEAVHNLHLDDNNRLNPDGEGWVVRVWLQLTDNPDSFMILREDKSDPASESRIALPRNRQMVIDSQRLWHATWHPGPRPRYALIVSFESGQALDRWIKSQSVQTANAS